MADRSNLIPYQRFDLKDALRIIDAPFEDREFVDGGLMGACEGVLSAGATTFENVNDSTKLIRFTEMVLVGYKNVAVGNDRARGGLIHFIPTAPKQLQTSVNVVVFAGDMGAIWWRSDLVETDLENRRRWEAGFPNGRGIAMRTMRRGRVYFAVTTSFATPPTDGETWYRLARFDYTAAPTAPVVTFCHALDLGCELSPTIPAAKWLGQAMMANRDVATNKGRSYGLARAVATLAQVVMAIKDRDHAWDLQSGQIMTAGEEDLLARTYRGLKQLDDDLSVVEGVVAEHGGTLTNHAERLEALEARKRIVFTTTLRADGTTLFAGGDWITSGGGTVTATKTGTGVWSLVFSGPIDLSCVVWAKAADPVQLDMNVRAGQTNSTTCYVETYNGLGAAADLKCEVMVTGAF